MPKRNQYSEEFKRETVSLARSDVSMMRIALGRISWWWQDAWLLVTSEGAELDVDHFRNCYQYSEPMLEI